MINRVVLTGRLTRDPELKTTPTGKSVVDFSIAVDRRVKGETDFFRVTAWGATAEFVSNYITKGRLVGVDGRLQSRKYTANDGTNREVVEVIADNVNALDRPRDDAGAGAGAGAAVASVPSAEEYDPFADN